MTRRGSMLQLAIAPLVIGRWVDVAPAGSQPVAGAYDETNETDLRHFFNHLRDMVRGPHQFVIAPMGNKGGVGTYRIHQSQ